MAYKLRDFVCEYCEKPFQRYVSGHQSFCSPTCRNKARTIPDQKCPICSSMFKPKIVSYDKNGDGIRKQTCSRKCGSRLHGQRLRENGHWNKTPQETIDEICTLYKTHTAKEVAHIVKKSIGSVQGIITKYCPCLPPEEARSRQRKFARINMLENNPRDEDALKKWRKENPEEVTRIAVYAQSKVMKDRPSSLEKKLHKILKSFNVEFESQFIIKDKFIVDVKIGNLIIEADGDYWHGHPRFEPLTDRQKAQQRRDAARNKYLRACDYEVERIWGSDMTTLNVKTILQKHSIL